MLELLVSLAVLLILIAVALPVFTHSLQSSRADTDVSELADGLGYARQAAIERGRIISIGPTAGGRAWSEELSIHGEANEPVNVLRVVPPITHGATLTLTSEVPRIAFDSLGGLAAPDTEVVMNYVLGSQSRTISVCLNGRVVVGGHCG